MTLSWPTVALCGLVLALVALCVWRDPSSASIVVHALVGIGTILAGAARPLLTPKGPAS